MEHDCVGLQTRQLSPREPQALGNSPLTHAPLTSQQPSQVDAEHGTAVSQPKKTAQEKAMKTRGRGKRTRCSERGSNRLTPLAGLVSTPPCRS